VVPRAVEDPVHVEKLSGRNLGDLGTLRCGITGAGSKG